MAARGDGPEGDELGADWLFGQLADDSAAEAATPDESDSPQAAPRSAWWSRRARSGETAPVEPVVDAGADASGAPPISQSATAPGDESLDWFSLATPAASAAPAPPGAPVEPSQPSLPSQPEPAPVDAVPAPFWAPTPQPPREPAPDAFDAPRTPPAPPARPPADPVLTSVEPPVTPRYAPEPPAAPGPATPAAPFALTWGDEVAPVTPAAPVTPTAQATPAAPAGPAAPAPSAPQGDESGLLGAPRRPRTWDELATGAVAEPPPAPVEPVAPAAPLDSPAPDSAARAAAAPERESWSNDPFAPPARPVAAASAGFDEELWSALQEPEASTPAVDRHPGTAQHRAVDEGVPGAPRTPFPAFASADRAEPVAEPAPPVDDLLASLTRPAPRPAEQPDERAGDEQPGPGRADPGQGRAGLAGPAAAGGAGLAGAAALGGASGFAGTSASGAGAAAEATGGESDLAALLGGRRVDDAHAPSEPASGEHDDPLGLGFGAPDAAPDDRDAGDDADQYGAHEYAPGGAAAADDAEAGYDWGLVGDPNGIDPRASDGPRDTAALLDAGAGPETAAAAAMGADASAGFASLAGAGLAEPEAVDAWREEPTALGASGRFDPMSDASTATAAAAAPLATAGGGRGSDPAVGGARSGDSGAGASGGGRPPRPLLWIAGGLALLVVLAGLFFVGTKLPLGEKSGATGGTATTAAPDEATAAAAAPTAAQPAGVHAWNTLFGGECLEPFTDAWAAEYTVVDCAAPHAAQLVLRGTVAGDAAAPYPGDAELATQLTAACRAPGVFDDAAIAGIPDLQVVFSFPVADQWAAGERTFYCFANRSSGEPLTVSIAGATPSQVVAG